MIDLGWVWYRGFFIIITHWFTKIRNWYRDRFKLSVIKKCPIKKQKYINFLQVNISTSIKRLNSKMLDTEILIRLWHFMLLRSTIDTNWLQQSVPREENRTRGEPCTYTSTYKIVLQFKANLITIFILSW